MNIIFKLAIFLPLISIAEPFDSGFEVRSRGPSSLEINTHQYASQCDLIEQNGDVNNDGKISSIDLLKLTYSFIKKNIFEVKYDLNGDKVLDSLDADFLRDYILKKLECQHN